VIVFLLRACSQAGQGRVGALAQRSQHGGMHYAYGHNWGGVGGCGAPLAATPL
jgi:hypothetical protein